MGKGAAMTTSTLAAISIEPSAPTLRARVLELLQKFGRVGMTDEQMQIALQMNPSTERPRRLELVAAGLVMDSGRTRKTVSGRKATVWVVYENRAAQGVWVCSTQGHKFGGQRADFNNEIFRVCERCGEVDESKRTQEQSI